MIVNGAAAMGATLDTEARAQLTLRQQIATDVVRRYFDAGFTVVYQDILIGHDLVAAVERLCDLNPRVVVLAPSVEILAQRDRERPKTGYSDGFPPSVLAGALARETPRIGHWIDSSALDVEQVVNTILCD
ncbi:phosphotransferase [Aminobacter sp. UC22_36]|uniref:phosphotransferase n=1 Tax=Aminobacter sp. UC22_36 TaxID=3374549 RepID=UPI0037572EFC